MKGMKWFLVLALGLAMGLAATGCGGGDGGNPLVGSWKLETLNGQTVPANYTQILTFRDNGTVEAATTYNGTTQTEVATWSEDGGMLTIISANDADAVPYSISGNTLTLVDSEGVITLKRQ